jgi:hypothetical protein
LVKEKFIKGEIVRKQEEDRRNKRKIEETRGNDNK